MVLQSKYDYSKYGPISLRRGSAALRTTARGCFPSPTDINARSLVSEQAIGLDPKSESGLWQNTASHFPLFRTPLHVPVAALTDVGGFRAFIELGRVLCAVFFGWTLSSTI